VSPTILRSIIGQTVIIVVFQVMQQIMLSQESWYVRTSLQFLYIHIASAGWRASDHPPAPTNKRTNKQTNKQANKQTNKRTNKKTNKQTNEQTNEQTNKRTNKQTNKRTNKQTNKQTGTRGR
jgi:hypothetical protein